ncbi:MAG TPA: tRNA epoxyqueuosine(34) reductase QueG, partial [Woeseiaceae bacterium]|nr:tRNA epoxyqueuosine(34) reductase QueG [Woeseiaceae bacterium]
MRRIGFEQWQRNLAVALGNAATSDDVVAALREQAHSDSALVREHVAWALAQHEPQAGGSAAPAQRG